MGRVCVLMSYMCAYMYIYTHVYVHTYGYFMYYVCSDQGSEESVPETAGAPSSAGK